MPKTTEQLAASKAGETQESNGFGSQERPLRPAGLYRLKNDDGETVDEIIVKVHPKFGDSQAAAAERVGYRFVRPANPGEVKEIEVDAKYLATENKDGSQPGDETLKGIQARLSLLEKENADLKAGKAAEETKGAADSDVKAQAKDEAKVAAAEQLENRGQAPEGTAKSLENELDNTDGDEGDDSSEGDSGEGDQGGEGEGEGEGTQERKPLNKDDYTVDQLKELAIEEEVELTPAEDTKAKIVAAIEKARDEKEGK